MDTVLRFAKADLTGKVVVACLGVQWLYASVASTRQVCDAVSTLFADQVALLLVDEDDDRTFCHSKDIVVGSPSVLVWYAGSEVRFRRPDWPVSPVVVGPFSFTNVENVLRAVLQQKSALKSDPGTVVDLPF
ncbi:unnamed protein product (mitochondrion) [Plasmodiophora brassicae]|uniref:Thioredoxin domain-containing protein n=1 Tax=Plasmodiophora brassicae TaxID=37360 RepID=A0A3P3YMD6_PLABS|nr:unnamed protein product [Plasmodiophora brassicae]